ncbi:hypothetical protein ACXHQ0_19825 [Vibrio antiquarius]|uniref:5'-3' exonuclease domain-containing protein n=1 Tax=Vibrio parahaemolyticus TaxID=670 RepID=A0AA46URX9_VIBPH|nr:MULTISPECIES: hypothetical protein [Vibrio harveyi group]KOE91150.1 hypothetical protein ACS91_07540 [Vibrio parahaemolyticus]MCS0314108.1 hypothetical protein [Vibrio diabolicus]UYV30486.1 hypothetical protein M5598_26120 [Vibrio parahaemolyticus]UYW19503.1 hypothetical protein IF561_24540 [Vibrio parahaemolyticus]
MHLVIFDGQYLFQMLKQEQAQVSHTAMADVADKIVNSIGATHALFVFSDMVNSWRKELVDTYSIKKHDFSFSDLALLGKHRTYLKQCGYASVQVSKLEMFDVSSIICNKIGTGKCKVTLITNCPLCFSLIGESVEIKDAALTSTKTQDWLKSRIALPKAMLGEYYSIHGLSSLGVPGVPQLSKQDVIELLKKYNGLYNIQKMIGEEVNDEHLKIVMDNFDQISRNYSVTLAKTDLKLGTSMHVMELRNKIAA